MLPNTDTLLTIFITSLLGSLHCVGMCGGLVAICSLGSQPTSLRQAAVPQFAYHGFRLLSYLVLGAVAGTFGSLFLHSSQTHSFQLWFGYIAGSILVVWGCVSLGLFNTLVRLPPTSLSSGTLSRRLGKIRADMMRRALGYTPFGRGALIGLISGLLPCGWLYAFVVAAAATQSTLAGSAVMAIFWLGTVPVLLGFAGVVSKLGGRFLAQLPKVTATLIIIIGVMTIAGRLTPNVDSSIEQHESTSCH